VLDVLGVLDVLADVHGTVIQREMLPFVQYLLRDGLNTHVGIERIKSWPAVLWSDEAVLPRVGVKAQPVRQGVCQRSTATRQGERAPGPMCPETLAKHSVTLTWPDLETGFNGAIRALATGSVFGKRVTGMADGTDVETTAHDAGGGQVTRQVRLEEKRGEGHEMAVTVYGWKVRLMIDAATTSPVAVKIGPMEEHASHGTRALGTQAQAHLAGAARLHTVVCDKGLLAGPARWWLAAPHIPCVVPANAHMAVTADARAQAMAQEGPTVGRRVHTVRHGQGRTAWTDRQETDVVGITGLTPSDP
jgi:hypothetical protein